VKGFKKYLRESRVNNLDKVVSKFREHTA
jgi:hypothetical protein